MRLTGGLLAPVDIHGLTGSTENWRDPRNSSTLAGPGPGPVQAQANSTQLSAKVTDFEIPWLAAAKDHTRFEWTQMSLFDENATQPRDRVTVHPLTSDSPTGHPILLQPFYPEAGQFHPLKAYPSISILSIAAPQSVVLCFLGLIN